MDQSSDSYVAVSLLDAREMVLITARPILNRIPDLTANLDRKVGGLGTKLAKNDGDDEDPNTKQP